MPRVNILPPCHQQALSSAFTPASLISFHVKHLCRCLIKTGDFMFLKRSWFLKQPFVAATPTPPILQNQTCCCLLWMFHTCCSCSLLPPSVHPLYLPGGPATISVHVQVKKKASCATAETCGCMSILFCCLLSYASGGKGSQNYPSQECEVKKALAFQRVIAIPV